jgi:hypothetical protein
MKTMTSPPEARTQADEAAAASSGTTRRRAVTPPGRVRSGTARTGTGAKGRSAATRTLRAPERRAVAPAGRPVRTVARRGTTAPRAPFAVLIVGLLGGALVGLLLLNTALAQQSFTLSDVQRENQQLDEHKQALQEDIARETSPEVLHAEARALGMRDAEQPGFVDPRTGRTAGNSARPRGLPDAKTPGGAAGHVPGGPTALVPSAAPAH